jgi:hypothetical protein
MLHFYEQDGKLVATSDYQSIPKDALGPNGTYTSRWDFKTIEIAQGIAKRLNDQAGKELYLATDGGRHISPRYDVIELPQVGDEVSYSFNGDSYPCGTIVKITKTLQIVTSDGKRFMYKNGGWKHQGWWLVKGHRYEQNPHF